MLRHLKLMVVGLTASLIMGVAAGQAADPAELDKQGQSVDRSTRNAGSQQVAGRLATELNASWGRMPGPYSAESLAAQRTQNGWGWGGVLIGNRIAQHMAESLLAANPTMTPAQALAQSTAAVTAARQTTGWGVIAQENGVKLGSLVSSVKQSSASLTAGLRSTDKQAAKSVDRGTPGAALGASERSARGAERSSAKSDKTRSDVSDFANSFDSGHQRGGSAVVAGPGSAEPGGHGGSGRGNADKGGGPGASAGGADRGGGNGPGGGPGGGGGNGGGNGGGGNGGGGGGGKGH